MLIDFVADKDLAEGQNAPYSFMAGMLHAALIAGAILSASQAWGQNGNRLSPDSPGLTKNPSLAGTDSDAPLDARATPSDRHDAISIDVLRHPITEKARRTLRKALETLNSGHYEEARKQLLAMLAKYPDFAAYVHSVLGVVYVKTNRFSDAANSFEQAVSFFPHDAETHYNFGISLACAMDYRRAESEVRRALELDPKNKSAHCLLSLLLDREGTATEHCDFMQPAPRTEVSSRGESYPGN
jgi:tetratricopeptide (TPR) repeat protein